MHFATLLLNFDEMHQVRQQAERLWPGESISETEVLRRFVMQGVRLAQPQPRVATNRSQPLPPHVTVNRER